MRKSAQATVTVDADVRLPCCPGIIEAGDVLCLDSLRDIDLAGYNPTTGKAYPKVVEGGTAVYGSDGSIFIVYSGSGYSAMSRPFSVTYIM